MNLIKRASKETHEILNNARTSWLAGEITTEQYNEIVLSCFRVEAEAQILGKYPEAAEEARRVLVDS